MTAAKRRKANWKSKKNSKLILKFTNSNEILKAKNLQACTWWRFSFGLEFGWFSYKSSECFDTVSDLLWLFIPKLKHAATPKLFVLQSNIISIKKIEPFHHLFFFHSLDSQGMNSAWLDSFFNTVGCKHTLYISVNLELHNRSLLKVLFLKLHFFLLERFIKIGFLLQSVVLLTAHTCITQLSRCSLQSQDAIFIAVLSRKYHLFVYVEQGSYARAIFNFI